jgi:hypothetical protein
MVGETENCDSSNYIQLDFYLPKEMVNLNTLKLNYKISRYRKYQKDPSSVVSLAGLNGVSKPADTTDWQDVFTLTATASTTSMVFAHGAVYWDATAETSPDQYNHDLLFRIYNQTDSTYYPSSSGVPFALSASGDTQTKWDDSSAWFICAPVDAKGKVLKVQFKVYAAAEANSAIDISYAAYGIAGMRYEIDVDTASWSVTDMTINIDGTDRTSAFESANGTLVVSENGTDSNNTINPTWLSNTDADSWHYIKLQPNGNCRIDADLFVQMFVASKVVT